MIVSGFRLKQAVFPPIDAEAPPTSDVKHESNKESGANDELSSSSEDEVEEGQTKKKPKKEKIGFRERKVHTHQTFFTFMSAF